MNPTDNIRYDYDKLIGEPVKIGLLNGKNIIIIPCYNEKEIVLKHIDLLSKQTTNNFDVIVVLSNIMDCSEIEKIIREVKYNFGIILVKRAIDSGSAGGFYLGEKYAIEKGYQCIILADADAFPIDNNIVETLISMHKRGIEIAVPECLFLLDEKIIYKHRGLHFYGMIDSELLKKAGLHFAPLYLGADDTEFMIRITKFASISHIKNKVCHPAHHSIFVNFDRSILYRINDMLYSIPECAMRYLYSFLFICLVYFIFGTTRARNASIHILRSIILRKYGKNAIIPVNRNGIKTGGRIEDKNFDIIITPLNETNYNEFERKKNFRYEYSGKNIKKLIGMCIAVAGKKVLLMPINNYAVTLVCICAKETWISGRKELYLLSKNENIFLHMIKFVLLVLTIPLFLMLGLLTLFMNVVRKENNIGYGIK
ncbi:MAG: glycosyltransferase [Candidatus Micrarchaeota archaeon]